MTGHAGWDGARIFELRVALGSAVKPLSRLYLMRMLNERLPEKDQISEPSIRRWEVENVEPPYAASAVMADLAGMTFEEFALGIPPEPSSEEGNPPVHHAPPHPPNARAGDGELRSGKRASRGRGRG